jgi:hypothetical protein
MGFFLVGRRRDSGTLQLLDGIIYDDRQSAIDALAEIDVPREIESEVFAIDLDSATPIVVVQKKSPIDSVEDEAIADAIVEEATVDVPQPPDASEEPAEEEDGDLHEALKGAASSLEGEGIVAPESVGPPSSAEDKAWPWDSKNESPAEPENAEDLTAEDELDEAIAEATAPAEYVPDLLEEPAVSVDDMVAMPNEDTDASRTAVMGAYDSPPQAEVVEERQPEAPAETEPAAHAEPAPLVESEVEAPSEAPTEPPRAAEAEVEEAAEPEPQEATMEAGGAPYVSPAFEDAPPPTNTKAQQDLETVLADLEISDPMGPVAQPLAEESPDVPMPPASDSEMPVAPVEQSPSASTSAETEEPATDPGTSDHLAEVGLGADVVDGPGFEGGDSDIADLTCDDCVYMNTCPKQGESDPASCGSFQWKSS